MKQELTRLAIVAICASGGWLLGMLIIAARRALAIWRIRPQGRL